ncbi:MAG: FMN-binding protein [Victivallaceae bacterium]|nr:FMN-binding protein [Victivallaceae bacterium]
MMDFKKTDNIFLLGLFLGVTAIVAAALMAWAFLLTEKPIAAAQKARLAKDLAKVMPAFVNAPGYGASVRQSPGGVSVRFLPAFTQGQLVGVAGEGSTPNGYAGKISVLAGLRPDGSIRSVIVTGHGETPGLGAEVCDRKEVRRIDTLFAKREAGKLADNAILDQFAGRTTSPVKWKLKKNGGDLAFKSGATITSGAVGDLTWEIAECFRSNREALCAEFQKKASGGKNMRRNQEKKASVAGK